MRIHQIVLFSFLFFAACKNSDPDGQAGNDGRNYSGPADLSIDGQQFATHGSFTIYRSTMCSPDPPFAGFIQLMFTAYDMCGMLEREECGQTPASSALWLSVNRNVNEVDANITPGTYPFPTNVKDPKADTTAMIGTAGFNVGAEPTSYPSFDTMTGQVTWGGSVTLDEVTDERVAGSIDATNRLDGSVITGTFTAFVCGVTQAIQEDCDRSLPIPCASR
jgi:hypothetical protein